MHKADPCSSFHAMRPLCVKDSMRPRMNYLLGSGGEKDSASRSEYGEG